MSSPSTTSQFINTLGVNVHVEYTDGKYASTSNVIADLSYLGITHVRDATLNPSNQGQGAYDALAAAGIKFDLFFQGNDVSSSLALVNAFIARHPGAVSMIEGPNEVNNFPISYAGLSGNAAAVSYQSALDVAVHADAALNGVPVANMTSYPDLAGDADYGNFHSYPKNGVQPGVTLSQNAASQAAVEGGRPEVMTEGGYTTLLSSNYFGGVDEATQAKYLLNMFLDNAQAGIVSSYVYQLLDAYSDPTNSDPNNHFGLFNLDNTPKLAATSIHNLTTILETGSDASAAASSFDYSLSGLPSTASSLSLTKAAGVHDLVLWNEATDWDPTTNQEISVPTSTIHLHLASAANVSVYDPLSGSTAVSSYSGAQDVSLSLTDHPLIVEVTQTNVAANAVTAASSSAVTASAAAASIITPSALSAASNATVSAETSSTQLSFDSDAKADVLWRNTDGTVGTWLSTHGSGVASYSTLANVDSGWTVAGIGDFDGDGKADVLWRNADGQTGEWLSSKGTGVASYVGLTNVDTGWHVAGVGDFDGDGKSDVLWRNADGQVGEWLSSKGSGVSSFVGLDTVDNGWSIAGVGDFDGDGKSDILWRNADGQTGEWLSSKGTGVSSFVALDTVDNGWSIAGVGDFDGDGKADVLWRNADGQVGEWLSSHGKGVASYVALGTVDQSWTIAGVGDFDGDGKADVLWRNVSGETGVWLSSHGTGAASYQSLAHVDMSWSIVGVT